MFTAFKSILLSVLVLGIWAGLGAANPPLPDGLTSALPFAVAHQPAQDFKVNGITEAEPGDVVILTPEGVENTRISWITFDTTYRVSKKPRDVVKTESGQVEFESVPANSLFFICPDKGPVKIACQIIPDDKDADIQTVLHVVEVKGAKPEPKPDPKPEPGPDPTPEPSDFEKSNWLVLVEESSERTVEVAKIVNSSYWLSGFVGRGYNRPLVYDDDSEEGKAFIESAKATRQESNQPFFGIMDKNGKFKRTFPVPSDGIDGLEEGVGPMTPYYEKDRITIYHGDCLDVLPELGTFDLLLTDPPYGISANKMTLGNGHKKTYRGEADWDEKSLGIDEIETIRAKAKKQIIWGGNYFPLPPTRCFLIWDKGTGSNDFADAELAWTNIDSVVKKYFESWVGANARDKNGCRWHPTQKSLLLMQWCMKQAGEFETVLDPFMGSGTTLVAAKQEGKQAVGIEREERYCEIAADRLSQGVLFGAGV